MDGEAPSSHRLASCTRLTWRPTPWSPQDHPSESGSRGRQSASRVTTVNGLLPTGENTQMVKQSLAVHGAKCHQLSECQGQRQSQTGFPQVATQHAGHSLPCGGWAGGWEQVPRLKHRARAIVLPQAHKTQGHCAPPGTTPTGRSPMISTGPHAGSNYRACYEYRP